MTDPYYSDDSVTVYHGDALDVLRDLPDASVDSVCTDPPYGLEFMGREWDSFKPAAFQEWCEAWARECLRVLKPGGHLLAFGGTRTVHRLTCGIEDAGFEIRDGIDWLYGSGFPKSLDVSKAIDKRPGVQRHREFAAHLAERRQAAGLSRADVAERIVGARTGACWNWEHHQFPEAKWWPTLRDLLDLHEATWGPVIAEAEREKVGTRTTGIGTGLGAIAYIADSENRDITAPATDAARQWEGWGTALKPAREPIVVARKPLAGTVAANVLEWGTGALNIDGCRVAGEPWSFAHGPKTGRTGGGIMGDPSPREGVAESHPAGRWPTNVIFAHAADCAYECVDGCPVLELDAQSGVLTSGANPTRRSSDRSRDAYGDFAGQAECAPARGADSGGASRFFPVFRYEAKAPAAERPRTADGTAHPTVKPLDLMRWLVRLVTPPGGTVLDPFAGSGSTAEACVIEGFGCITIERDATYLPLIDARLGKDLQPVLDLDVA